jgi:hypothetical protein
MQKYITIIEQAGLHGFDGWIGEDGKARVYDHARAETRVVGCSMRALEGYLWVKIAGKGVISPAKRLEAKR